MRRLSFAPGTLRLAPCALAFALGTPLASQAPTELERAVLAETNLARTNPSAYAAHLEEMLGWFRGEVMYRPGNPVGLRTNEGPAAFREAIAFLRRQAPLEPLAWSDGIARAARDHARDQGPSGGTGHTGRDGSSMGQRMNRYGAWRSLAAENIDYGSDDARRVVISLIVDDGVASRGHRANIFNAQLRVAGVGCGTHQRYRHMCVIDYAAGYEEQGEAPRGDPLPRAENGFLRTNWKGLLLRSR